MSETFLIKKTAYDSIRGDIVDRNANSFIIGPGELNGPAGAARDSDLELYGFGSLKWGEGVDQNLYRILENFACARKETGDTHPTVIGSPGGYDASIHPVMPKDESDLGVGNGITTSIMGQFWYDTTSKTTFSYDGTNWVTAGVAPGTIRLDARATISINDLECNGQAVNQARYAALYTAIGDAYTASPNATTFDLPDITPPVPTTGTVLYIIRT